MGIRLGCKHHQDRVEHKLVNPKLTEAHSSLADKVYQPI